MNSRRDFLRKASLGVVAATVVPSVVKSDIVVPEVLGGSVKRGE